MKGHDSVREAAARLRDLPGISFHGFVEGDDIATGTVDVVVTDGFTGNIALKTVEGTAKLYTQFLRAAFKNSILAKLGYIFVKGALNRVRERLDPRKYNGAMLLGLKGIVVKSHGSSDEVGFANAVGVAADLIINGFLERIRDELALLHAAPEVVPTTPVDRAAV